MIGPNRRGRVRVLEATIVPAKHLLLFLWRYPARSNRCFGRSVRLAAFCVAWQRPRRRAPRQGCTWSGQRQKSALLPEHSQRPPPLVENVSIAATACEKPSHRPRAAGNPGGDRLGYNQPVRFGRVGTCRNVKEELAPGPAPGPRYNCGSLRMQFNHNV
jgi:hypothetical protein